MERRTTENGLEISNKLSYLMICGMASIKEKISLEKGRRKMDLKILHQTKRKPYERTKTRMHMPRLL